MSQNQPSLNEITVEKIILYPIKSCDGMEVDEWEISEEGNYNAFASLESLN